MSYIDYNNLCISELVVSENCVKTVISQLNNSAPGHDGLPPSIMKQLTNEYVIPLTHLINLSIVQGDFPSELKKSEKKSYQYISLKRNISLRIIDLFRYCHIFSKIYERVIYNHLMQYINSNDILYDKQFGFRKGHSTSHAIITLVEKVSKTLATGKIVVGVYLDIRKAFNCVRHSTLLDKLHKIGIRGNLFCLIKSYLISRTQYVHYNGCNSSTKSIEYKVPKGSIRGPLFFILFYECFFHGISITFFYIFVLIIPVFF